jgi:hypothetical protein
MFILAGYKGLKVPCILSLHGQAVMKMLTNMGRTAQIMDNLIAQGKPGR